MGSAHSVPIIEHVRCASITIKSAEAIFFDADKFDHANHYIASEVLAQLPEFKAIEDEAIKRNLWRNPTEVPFNYGGQVHIFYGVDRLTDAECVDLKEYWESRLFKVDRIIFIDADMAAADKPFSSTAFPHAIAY